MTTQDKAQRATVQIGSLSVDGFQMPDGSYRMSQTQAAESVGKPQRNARHFLESKGIKALRGESYMPDTIEVDSSEQARGQARFNARRFLDSRGIKALWGKGYTSAISAIKVAATGSLTAAPRDGSRTLATTGYRGFQYLMPHTAIPKIYPEAMPESGQV